MKKKNPSDSNYPRPAPHQVHPESGSMSRREFLAKGIVAGGSMIVMPSLFAIAARKAIAAENTCALPALNTTMVPVICIDLQGGGNILGNNFLVGGAGGQRDFILGSSGSPNAYRGVGLKTGGTTISFGTSGADDFLASGSLKTPVEISNQLNEEFGLVMHPDSAMLKGMLDATDASLTRPCVDGVVFCTASADDTSNNPFNPGYWLAKSGLVGRFGASVATSPSLSGGSSTFPTEAFDPRFRPMVMTNPGALSGMVEPGALFSAMATTPELRGKIFSFMDRMSSAALSRFTSLELSEQLKAIAGCGTGLVPSLMATPATALDATQDPVFQSVFPELVNGNNGALSLDISRRLSVVCKALVEGFAGTGTITLGGHDYHNGTITDGRTRDVIAGRVIGRILEVFRRKGRPVMIYLFTDGGVYNGNLEIDNPVWTGDDGEKSGSVVITLKPGSPRASQPRLSPAFLQQYGRQIGHFQFVSDKLGVKRSAVVTGADVTAVVRAVIANHMALHTDDLGLIRSRLVQVTGSENFSTAAGGLERYVAFKKIA